MQRVNPLQALQAMSRGLWNNGFACAVLNCVLHTTVPVIIRLLPRMPGTEIALIRALISLPLLMLAFRISGSSLIAYDDVRNLPWLIARGIAGTTTLVFLFSGVQVVPLADAQVMLALHTPATCLLGFLLLGEQMTIAQVLGMVTTLVGVVLVLHPPMLFGGKWDAPIVGILYMGMACAGATATTLLVRFLSSRESTTSMMLWLQFAELVVVTPLVMAGWPQPTVLGFHPADYAYMLLMGAVAFAAQFANNRGAELLPAAVSGTISTLQVPLGFLWSLALSEASGTNSTPLGLFGTVLVVIGLVAVNAWKRPGLEHHYEDHSKPGQHNQALRGGADGMSRTGGRGTAQDAEADELWVVDGSEDEAMEDDGVPLLPIPPGLHHNQHNRHGLASASPGHQ